MATSKRLVLGYLNGVVALASLMLGAEQASANECAHFTSTQARAQGELRLCDHTIDGVTTTFACRVYHDADFRYELLFKGGPSPKAIYQLARGEGESRLRAMSPAGAQRQTCRQTPPPGVPATSTYRGTGVCLDARDRSVPCSIYEHAGAREPVAKRYFVYYAPDGGGVLQIEVLTAGRNERALEAEIAFQLGRSLAISNCCNEQARGYFAHAAALFPDDAIYRTTLEAHVNGPARTNGAPLAAFTQMLDPSH